jgi:hypothetical protein
MNTMPLTLRDMNQTAEPPTRGRLGHLAGGRVATKNASAASGGLPLAPTELQSTEAGRSPQEAAEGVPLGAPALAGAAAMHVLISLPAAAVAAKQMDTIGGSCHLRHSRELDVSTLLRSGQTQMLGLQIPWAQLVSH